MFRLYSNENFPQPVVNELRRLGCDVVTVLESGHAGQAWPDDEVLEYARGDNRILLTLNRRDFFALHKTKPDYAGIVACTVDADFTGQAARIFSVLCDNLDMAGVLICINRAGQAGCGSLGERNPRFPCPGLPARHLAMPAKKAAASKKATPGAPSIIPPEKICTLDGFLRQFVEQHNCRTDQPFCFILGAGASRDSGIRTGGEMAGDWLKKLHEDCDFDGRS